MISHLAADEVSAPSLGHVDRQQVNHWEHEHPNQVDKVPVQSADFNIFMFQFIYPPGNYQQINTAGGDVEHVHAGNAKEGGPEEWRRARPLLGPLGRQLKWRQSFRNQM